MPQGINFAIFSAHATACHLVIYEKSVPEPLAEISIPERFRVGHVYALELRGIDPDKIEYGYRFDGPSQPGDGHHFDSHHVVIDPYARLISGREVFGERPPRSLPRPLRGRIPTAEFDWEGDRPLNLPIEDLIIYEMHVRSFTQHHSSQVEHPGTYHGLIEKIPYLKELGINCVELLPVQEFDEFENNFINPFTGNRLLQYWGYGTLGFFAPKAGFAAGDPINEFKSLVKALHQAGIEVMLDVVYNHSGEGGSGGHTISFRGIDNRIYYLLTPTGEYYNFSGTGNTLNCNHPVVREMILDSLRYWVTEFHIDGFRFDLASIMVRDETGQPLADPPIVNQIARDPVLANTKIVAEAWDAAGLYHVGSFPHYGRWSEWNGKYRDSLRKFMKGDTGEAGAMVQRILGSPDLYSGRGPAASINFVACHDGFTLADIFMYNHKHNEANGEDNRDGNNDNHSWNFGIEGPTTDYQIQAIRSRMMRNTFAILLVSQGVPLFHMGDEIAHSKRGNNNTYGHDNDLNWLNWESVSKNAALYRYVSHMIAFRQAHPALRSHTHLSHTDLIGSGYPDISWHGVQAWEPDWSFHSHTLAFMLCGRHVAPGREADDYIYVGINMHWVAHVFELPELPTNLHWHIFTDTSRRPPYDICAPGDERLLGGQKEYVIESRTVIILVGR